MNCVDLSLSLSHVCNPQVLNSYISVWNAVQMHISAILLKPFMVVGQRLGYGAILSYVTICYAV